MNVLSLTPAKLLRRPVLASGLAQSAARLVLRELRRRPPGGALVWDRANHRGDTVTLLEGPAYVAGAAAGVALGPGLPPRVRAAGLIALAGAGVFGAIDDLRESDARKGLRGHLTSLAQGEFTTGGLKVLGIGATGLVAGLLVDEGGSDRLARRVGRSLVSGAVIAGSANLINLLDLRPGRALKVVLVSHVPLRLGRVSQARSAVLAHAAAGAATGLIGVDLAEEAMLGDTGANAAGALLGLAAVQRLGPAGQAALLAVLTGLTLASEKVSFTKVIESTPVLRELDAYGRRPRD